MASPQPQSARHPEWLRLLADYLGLLAALGLLILVFSLATKHFFGADTFRTIANQIPAVMLVATPKPGQRFDPEAPLPQQAWWPRLPFEAAAQSPIHSSGML